MFLSLRKAKQIPQFMPQGAIGAMSILMNHFGFEVNCGNHYLIHPKATATNMGPLNMP